ncbi:MAG: TlyA family RNA methyltransferase [Actinomycetota bacterium]|nr:TlyA family RNA methyltransferase [Actinomycetota bacterium]
MSGRRRLDIELVRRGLVNSREQAQAAVAAGEVLVRGAVADKAARLVDSADAVILAGRPPRFVSRGGLKLDAALDGFDIDVTGRRALDAGASTGGFTDCLLQRGAATVVAVDVGRGQLHQRLAADPRVHSRERTNIRFLTLDQVGGSPFDVVVADLSFISLRTVAPVLLDRLSGPDADVVVLVKPQFEAGRQAASAGRGVIRDPAVWSQTLLHVLRALTDHGAAMIGIMVSPLTGADGNVEFLVYCRARVQMAIEPDLDRAVAAVVAEAAGRHGMEEG